MQIQCKMFADCSPFSIIFSFIIQCYVLLTFISIFLHQRVPSYLMLCYLLQNIIKSKQLTQISISHRIVRRKTKNQLQVGHVTGRLWRCGLRMHNANIAMSFLCYNWISRNGEVYFILCVITGFPEMGKCTLCVISGFPEIGKYTLCVMYGFPEMRKLTLNFIPDYSEICILSWTNRKPIQVLKRRKNREKWNGTVSISRSHKRIENC